MGQDTGTVVETGQEGQSSSETTIVTNTTSSANIITDSGSTY